ncbi:hypothetical protein FB548_2041 [Pseudoxanthomonas sp. 3HH-4]|uniref:hypothetical protein n=1 Tax=Pseudoxanthomonas sp. 3HH-4 TaxID=1690214 RepID=UPI00114DEB00|nr:hypothetical protein [Pseudoxanthomonas sp. 3HH-4]TQM12116.1 hypothetical protein FB548_2041 [Pseudoxanthomonas sp. 3HH-4]
MLAQARRINRLSIMALLSCLACTVRAAEPLDTFSARIGGYVTTFDTEVRADGETQSGTDIDLDRDLGLDDDAVIAYVGLTWRPWDRHEFGLSYHGNGTDETRVLSRDIEFDGNVYEASATVRAEFDVKAYEAYYVWWAASDETWALGPRAGLVWYSVDMKIDLELDAQGEQAGGTVSGRVSADLPAPTIGAAWRWSPAEDWRISADAGYFSAEINDMDADVIFGRAGVEWFPWDRVGFSVDYVISSIKVDAMKTSFDGHLDFVDSGIRLGAVYRF